VSSAIRGLQLARTQEDLTSAADDSLGNMQNGVVYALPGSAIAGGAVTGTLAGVAAAKDSLQMEEVAVDEEDISRARQVVRALKERQGGFGPGWVTQLLQNHDAVFHLPHQESRPPGSGTSDSRFHQEHLVPGLLARDPDELRLAHVTKNMALSAELRLRSAPFPEGEPGQPLPRGLSAQGCSGLAGLDEDQTRTGWDETHESVRAPRVVAGSVRALSAKVSSSITR
jgi:hypothetical protein